MSSFAVPNPQVLGNYPPAIAAALATLAQSVLNQNPTVKAVQDTAVPSLAAAFVVVDGVTCFPGDLILLADQATGLQNGVWMVGTPTGSGGTAMAPLTRPSDSWPSGGPIVPGTVVDVQGGGLKYAGTQWKTFCATGALVDATDPQFYPDMVKYTTAAAAAGVTPTFTGAFVMSPTSTSIIPVPKTPGGTQGTPRISGQAAGIKGNSAIVVTSSSGTDTSTFDITVLNW